MVEMAHLLAAYWGLRSAAPRVVNWALRWAALRADATVESTVDSKVLTKVAELGLQMVE